MTFYPTFIGQLLRAYHGREPISPMHFELLGIDQIRYLCKVGLGPIAHHTYGELLHTADPDTRSLLQSADLTTRAIYRQMENATVEILESLNSAGVVPTLLKGISTAYEFYNPPHLRLMGDVDILIDQSEVDVTMLKLADLGYDTDSQEWLRYAQIGHHHLPGARNPETGVTVEVHTGLFVPGEPFSLEPIFQIEALRAQSRRIDYRGFHAMRFSPELQFAYTISHWGLDGNWALNVTGINDAIHILRRHESDFNWAVVAEWIAENKWIYPNIAVLVSYLNQTGVFPRSEKLRDALAHSDVALAPGTSKLLLWLLHNYPFNAAEKNRSPTAHWRAQAIWKDLTRPGSRDIAIPYLLLKIALRSIHHGRYNPLGWLWSLYKNTISQLRSK